MLFSRDKTENEKPKQQSVMGFLFKPDIAGSIRPIGESVSMFVRLIAMVFASSGLFPKNHPALTGLLPPDDPRARVTLIEIILTGWRKLSFTKEGMPKVIFFFAAVGTLVFFSVFAVSILLSLFVGKAHAESMFTPPSTDGFDWGINWIDYIFLGKSFVIPGNFATNVPDTCTWQQGIGAALSYYSAGILVLAGVILLYHLTSMVVETAHTGKVMGKANQIWAPIRLVFAIGLLVPIGAGSTGGTCTVSGLNTGQYVIVQVARWGSGLASNVWQKFVNVVNPTAAPANSGSNSCTQQGSPSCITAPPVDGAALGMLSSLACMYIYNYYINGVCNGGSWCTLNDSIITTPSLGSTDVGGHYYGNKQDGSACGGYSVNKPIADTDYQPVSNVQLSDFTDAINTNGTLETIARTYYVCFIPATSSSSNCPLLSDKTIVTQAISDLNQKLQTDVNSKLATADGNVASRGMFTGDSLYAKGGWMSAGTWFNLIAKTQGVRSGSVRGGLPSVVMPNILQQGHRDKLTYAQKTVEEATVRDLSNFNAWIGYNVQSSSTQTSASTAATSATVQDNSIVQSLVDKATRGELNPVDWLAVAVNTAFSWYNVWTPEGSSSTATDSYLNVKFNNTKNPLSEVANFGQNLVTTSSWFATVGALLYAAGKWAGNAVTGVVTGGLGAAAEVIGMLCFTIAAALFSAGLAIGYVLPLLPFIRFFFGALTWIIGVFEALVAAPILALAHLNPEGDGLPGAQAKQGYHLILNIFLRPVLMIFGLMAAYLLFCVALGFLNTMFVLATMGTTNSGAGGVSHLAKLIYSIMYCALVYICGNNCFKAIGMFPQHALRWIGSSGHHEGMGNPATMGAAIAGVGTYFMNQGLQNIAKGPGESINKGMQGKQAALTAETNRIRHIQAGARAGDIESQRQLQIEKTKAQRNGMQILPDGTKKKI